MIELDIQGAGVLARLGEGIKMFIDQLLGLNPFPLPRRGAGHDAEVFLDNIVPQNLQGKLRKAVELRFNFVGKERQRLHIGVMQLDVIGGIGQPGREKAGPGDHNQGQKQNKQEFCLHGNAARQMKPRAFFHLNAPLPTQEGPEAEALQALFAAVFT